MIPLAAAKSNKSKQVALKTVFTFQGWYTFNETLSFHCKYISFQIFSVVLSDLKLKLSGRLSNEHLQIKRTKVMVRPGWQIFYEL